MADTYLPVCILSVVPQDGKLRIDLQDAHASKAVLLMTPELAIAMAQQICGVVAQMPLPERMPE